MKIKRNFCSICTKKTYFNDPAAHVKTEIHINGKKTWKQKIISTMWIAKSQPKATESCLLAWKRVIATCTQTMFTNHLHQYKNEPLSEHLQPAGSSFLALISRDTAVRLVFCSKVSVQRCLSLTLYLQSQQSKAEQWIMKKKQKKTSHC